MVCLIDAETPVFQLHKNLLRLGLALYFCCFLLHSFLTTKKHPSDVEPSYIPIFSQRLPVGMSKACSCFMQIMDNNSKDLGSIVTKIDRYQCPWLPYKCNKFKKIGEQVCRVFKCAKR